MKRHPLAIAIAVVIDVITALPWYVAQVVGVASMVVVVMVMLCAELLISRRRDYIFCASHNGFRIYSLISKLAPNMYNNLMKHLTIHNK